jgi:hypothetical protein
MRRIAAIVVPIFKFFHMQPITLTALFHARMLLRGG